MFEGGGVEGVGGVGGLLRYLLVITDKTPLGALDRRSPCHLSILRNANAACLCRLCPCYMSNLRKGYVPCHYNFNPPVSCH